MRFIIFFSSIILHECSHIVVAILLGYKLKNFKFLPFGTYIEFREHPKSKNDFIKNIAIFYAGPISNFLIVIIFLKINSYFSYEIVYTNFILGIFNLLPLNPLDGSKIIKEILKLILGNKKGNIYSYNISKTFLCLLTFLYSVFIVKIQNISLFIMILFFWYIDYKESKRLNIFVKAYEIVEQNRKVNNSSKL